jgi:proliferating cell nuclear antigen PCNA
MEFKNNAVQIKTIVDVVKDLVTDVNLVFRKAEISIVAMDPEKVVGVSLSLTKFEHYEYNHAEDVYIGINMQHFYKLIRGVSVHDTLVMEVCPETTNVLKIQILNPTNGIVSTTSLYSLDIEKVQAKLPDVAFECTGRIPTADFLRSVKTLSHGSKQLTISAKGSTDPTYLTLAAKGSVYVYTTSISICPAEDGLHWLFFRTEAIRGQYMTKFIEKFIKPSIGKQIELSFTSDGLFGMSYPDLDLGTLSVIMVPILDN